MQTSRRCLAVRCLGAAVLAAAGLACPVAPAQETAPASPWHMSLAVGMLDFEGDEAVKDAALFTARLGRDLDEHWSVEGAFALVPSLDESVRMDWRDGARVSRLEEAAGAGVDDTWSMRLTIELLRHLAPRARVSPFLAAGGGLAWYADGMPDDVDPLVQGGGGLLVRLNDSWALRADARAVLAGRDSEFNGTYSVGLQWSPGDKPAPAMAGAALPRETATPAQEATPVESTKPSPAATDADENLLVYVLRLGFDPGDWKIKSEYYSEIGVIAKALQDHPGSRAHIAGHVDTYTVKGKTAADRLSRRRAEAVRDALVKDWGIPAGRLTPEGFGASRLTAPSEPPKGNPENERIDVTIKRAIK